MHIEKGGKRYMSIFAFYHSSGCIGFETFSTVEGPMYFFLITFVIFLNFRWTDIVAFAVTAFSKKC
jgi:hypothetical protein